MTVFYLGTHRTNWLWELTDVPLFCSHRILSKRVSPFPKATTRWALDSGGFTELQMHGKWLVSPEEYVAAVYRYRDELGSLDWASPQDWMCEPVVINGGVFNGVRFAGTNLSVLEHQHRTVYNFLELRALAPDLPFIPVLQGWELEDYHRCIDLYADAGVDLTAEPLVGVGSVCRRESEAAISLILQTLQVRGLRLHGYGVKKEGLTLSSPFLTSADSMAWSYGARMDAMKGRGYPGCTHKTCANCVKYALRWRAEVIASLAWQQHPLEVA